MAYRRSTTFGFKRTSSLLTERVRRAGESRGFAVSSLLTHWDEVAGPDMAAIAQPVKISYGRGGMGATLTVLTTGAHAPMLEMQKESLRERVNAAYGYNAISRVHLTQTAPTGFAEGKAQFGHKPKAAPAGPDPKRLAQVTQAAQTVANDDLRAALERLGANVLSKTKP